MPKKKSSSRILCKICNVWIADNKIQKRQHEEAAKHRQAKQALLKDIAERNERKAKDEQKKAALILGTEAAQEAAKTAAVAQQLLDTVAGGGVTRTGKQSASKRPREPMRQENIGEDLGADGAARNQVEGEDVEENVYPLPASSVYGEWKPVLDGNTKHEQEIGGPVSGLEPTDIAHASGIGKDNCDGPDGKEKEAAQIDIASARKGEEKEELEEGKVEVTFKRRKAPGTRRVRRKTSAR